MAKQTTVQLIDDIDGTEASQTIQFAIGGITYSIDLNDNNADEFDETFAPYIAVARRETGSRRSSSRRSSPSGADPRAVREWAATNGIQVNQRGRIPHTIVDKYLAAQT
jgi:hypothetical protein